MTSINYDIPCYAIFEIPILLHPSRSKVFSCILRFQVRKTLCSPLKVKDYVSQSYENSLQSYCLV